MEDMKTIIKKKMNTHEYNIQELWDMTKRPNPGISGLKEGGKIQTKGTGNLLNEF
jgi:hypothetical protein